MHHTGGHRCNPLAKIKREHYTGYPGICVVIFLNYAGTVQRAGLTWQLRESPREFSAERGKRKREKPNDVRVILRHPRVYAAQDKLRADSHLEERKEKTDAPAFRVL